MSEKLLPELLPCPFCGGEAEFIPYKRDGLTLKCKSLGCVRRDQRALNYSIESLKEWMTAHWNRRAAIEQNASDHRVQNSEWGPMEEDPSLAKPMKAIYQLLVTHDTWADIGRDTYIALKGVTCRVLYRVKS